MRVLEDDIDAVERALDGNGIGREGKSGAGVYGGGAEFFDLAGQFADVVLGRGAMGVDVRFGGGAEFSNVASQLCDVDPGGDGRW